MIIDFRLTPEEIANGLTLCFISEKTNKSHSLLEATRIAVDASIEEVKSSISLSKINEMENEKLEQVLLILEKGKIKLI